MGRVESRLGKVTKQLTLYPERPNNPTSIINQEVVDIAGIISNSVRGGGTANTLRNAVVAVIKSFKKNLLDYKPSLNCTTPGWKKPSISLDSDNEPETPTPLRTAMPVRPSATPTPSRKRPATDFSALQQRVKPDPAGAAIEKTVYTLDGLREKYQMESTSGIPGTINSNAHDTLILSALESWNAAVARLIENAKKEVLSTVQQAVNSRLSNRSSTQFYTKSHEILAEFVAQRMDQLLDRITWLCSCEQEKPITFSKFEKTEESRHAELDLARKAQRVYEHFETREAASNIRATPREKRMEKARDDAWVAKELGADEWAKEVRNAAYIFAYYDTASTCFVDTVAKCLEFGIMAPLREHVKDFLSASLHIEDADVCTQLLAEDPERERQRTKLLAEQAKLVEAIAELKGLQG